MYLSGCAEHRCSFETTHKNGELHFLNSSARSVLKRRKSQDGLLLTLAKLFFKPGNEATANASLAISPGDGATANARYCF